MLYDRLRCPPWAKTVPGSLPVLFFGDIYRAKAATIGLNPSWLEYLERPPRGVRPTDERRGERRRFATLGSLAAPGSSVDDRSSLTDGQCAAAIEMMRKYFIRPDNRYSWFAHLERVLSGLTLAYSTGHVAQLDVVQEATYPSWSLLDSAEIKMDERANDAEFLRHELEAFDIDLLLCNGRTVGDTVTAILPTTMASTGSIGERFKWSVAMGVLAERSVWVVTWNQVLHRPTGLGAKGELAFGRQLLRTLTDLGWTPPEPEASN